MAAVAECISEGNVLVTGVESLPSLGLAVAAGMMAVVVEIMVIAEQDSGCRRKNQSCKYARACL